MKYVECEIRHCGQDAMLAYYHAHWTRADAPLLDELGAVIDHVNAFSKGGVDSLANLITSCNRCNGRKSAAPVEIWERRPKPAPVKGKYGEPQHWDGLSSLFIVLARRYPEALTTGEREWLKELVADGCAQG
jgi:hypothetical protein